MSYFRSYFSKNNTIIKNSQVNTAKNPNTEIFYGSGFSKFIFKVDLSLLKDKLNNGDFVLNEQTKHYLHLTNTIFGDDNLIGNKRSTGRQRTTSFDLIIFKIDEYWDEGVGFDYEKVYDFTSGNETFDLRPSNWYFRTTIDNWSENGVYSTNPDVITTIHFDNGNEDIHADITDYVNSILTGDTVNNGLGIAFAPAYENVNNAVDQSVSFFTKYTQTFFEPYVESIFDDLIIDNRNNFIGERENNLYLYVKDGTDFYDLDILPTVDILNSYNQPITGYTGLTTTKIQKGIYKVNFILSNNLCNDKKFLYDKWRNLRIDGVYLDDVTQKFIAKPFTSVFNIGENKTSYDRYVIQFFGVKQNEKIKQGEKRKITVFFRSINHPNNILVDEVFYRIYIKEGRTQVTVFDWTQLDKTSENSFFIDTSFMIPREYSLEIKAHVNNEVIMYNNEIKFEIISEK